MRSSNPIGLAGISFIEFASAEPDELHRVFTELGFSRVMRRQDRAVELYRQGEIVFLLNHAQTGHAAAFRAAHGPSVVSMGWRTTLTPTAARDIAVSRGARAGDGDHLWKGEPMAALVGVGDSLVYLTPAQDDPFTAMGFIAIDGPDLVADKGLRAIDHLALNVARGTLHQWSSFHEEVFGFTQVRYFDIRGATTGLVSYALRSPCGCFYMPVNEGTEARSQVNEYLERYRGPGVQHVAFLTDDLLRSLRALNGAARLRFLDIEPGYYDDVFLRVPNVTEDHAEIARRNVLADGDADGYLLQILSHDVIGPIFFELIQRRNHTAFGEGNFGALFRSIEREQERRGYLRPA